MLHERDAWMNGVALSDVSPDIFITEVQCKPAKIEIAAAQIAGRHGERLGSTRWKNPQVTIQFLIRKTDADIRQKIVQDVYAWAREGTLQLSGRKWKQLRVICTEPPSIPNDCQWSDPISMTLMGIEHAFWEETVPAVLSFTGSSGSGTMYVPGNIAEALVEVTVMPTGTMDNITLIVGDTSMTLSGVSATASQPLTISYDERAILAIRRGNVSVLDKRTAESADDLRAVCGKISAISFSASASCNVQFQARGLWTV